MRLFGKIVLVFGVSALMAAPALAQQGRGFGGGMGGGPGLLANKSVQQELKLDAQQTEKVTKLAEELGAKRREEGAKLQDLAPEERRTKMQEVMKTANENSRKTLKEVLTADQLKRFEQVELQQRGINAFADAAVEKQLKLSDDQKAKLKELSDSTSGQMREIFQSSQGNFQEAREKMAPLRKESMAKASALLDSGQKATWKELTGEPFEVKFEPRPQN
jgi:Spy/CpxP family protein refolding chaperone